MAATRRRSGLDLDVVKEIPCDGRALFFAGAAVPPLEGELRAAQDYAAFGVERRIEDPGAVVEASQFLTTGSVPELGQTAAEAAQELLAIVGVSEGH